MASSPDPQMPLLVVTFAASRSRDLERTPPLARPTGSMGTIIPHTWLCACATPILFVRHTSAPIFMLACSLAQPPRQRLIIGEGKKKTRGVAAVRVRGPEEAQHCLVSKRRIAQRPKVKQRESGKATRQVHFLHRHMVNKGIQPADPLLPAPPDVRPRKLEESQSQKKT
ncbi:hypothetical protein B0T16DRAFT_7589 [Cercophora newfieldiana]|uniref:Uncharacterized protein n=1 Tax=Cercophora newfieldiana TaxID=92897 RepID=A0AA39YML6_9PEZI|nr:hypothetical protein B0T16DRAFT_7589 [Cercophora newfieldiana]